MLCAAIWLFSILIPAIYPEAANRSLERRARLDALLDARIFLPV